MKTIGVIGGLGPQATMDFESRVHKVSQELIPQHENQGYPPMVTWYIRHPPMKFTNGQPQVPLEPDRDLLAIARQLGMHADFLVIPSNTPHLFIQEIERAANRKVISIVDLVVEDLRRRAVKRVGVLAIGFALEHGLYQNRIIGEGMTCEIISSGIAAKLDKAIFTVMEGKDGSNERATATAAIQFLRGKNVDAIVLGCSEVPLMLQGQEESKDLINPTQLLAEAAVKHALL